jgi:protein TonB
MTDAFHWRKAITVSVFLHIFLLASAGYLTAGLTASIPRTEEIVMDLDLVSDPGNRAGNTPEAPEQAASPPAPRPAVAESTPVEPVQTETAANPVVTASALSMAEAEAPSPVSGLSRDTGGAGGNVPGTSASVNGIGGSGSGSGIAAPGILSKAEPVYPPAARQAGLEGTVVLKIQILTNGRSGEISVTRSSGHPSLDESAVAAVRQWQFIPAKDLSNGRTVTCTTTLPVSFRLHGHK